MNKIKKLISILAISFISINSLFLCNTNANEKLSTYEKNQMLGATPREWESSNLREWLNSNKEDVDYTAIPPTYEEEKGFLHTDNFTVEEYEAIAITRHGASNPYSINSTISTIYPSIKYLNRNVFIYNDKVFIINYSDIFNYFERNGEWINLRTKYFSDYLKQTTNRLDKYEYLVNSGYVNNSYINSNWMYNSTFKGSRGGSLMNIAPALSLKPDYVLDNGIKAKDLELGSSVYFGSYNNEPIEWDVINISDEGYPLLFSTKIIAQKEYDAPGDINPTKSDFINFHTYDVDISSNEGENRSWETGNTITSTPTIEILNEEILLTPTYEESITIQVQATDELHGIRSITLPDGTKVYNDYAEYTITKNGQYTIFVENNEGVISSKHIITRAINTKAEIEITTNKDEDNKWTNKPVNVNITSSNNGVYLRTITGREDVGYSSYNSGSFPSWMLLGSKQIRVTGTLINAITDEDIEKYDLNIYAPIYVRCNLTLYSSNNIWNSYPIIKSVTFKELKEKGTISIDEIYTIPDNYYNVFNVTISIASGSSIYMREGYSYSFSDFTFELLEKDPLEIVEIHMPNNNIVYDNKATYTVFENGTYTFTAVDNNGESFSKDVDVAIDTVKPNIDITYNTKPTNDILTLDISSYDDLSGIKSIKLPNGEYRTNENDMLPLNTTYNIVENGTYTFVVTDFAGNTTTKSITITNVDRIPPNMEYSLNPSNFTNQDVTINVQATDVGFGYSHMILPNGSITSLNNINYTVNENGVYYFLAYDNIGNESSLKVKIDIIDRNRPTVDIIKDPNNNNWVNENVNITIDSEDN